MANAGNFSTTRDRGLALYEKTIAAAYTARTGRPTDGFIFDSPILITDPAANFTLTVPNGHQVGQRLIILMTSNTSSKTATITTTTGDDNTVDTAGDFVVYEWMGATSGWQKIHGEVAS